MSSGSLDIALGTAPATPSSGYVRTYADTSDDRLKSVDDNGVTSIASQVIKPNVLINGGFDFFQRQAPATLTTYSNTTGRSYGADRWGMTNENASVQIRRYDTIASPETGITSRYYARLVKITNPGKMVLSQVVEGTDTAPLRGRVVRFQVRMKYGTNAMTVRLGMAYLTSAGTVDTMPATFVTAFNAAGTDPTLGTNLNYQAPSIAENGTISGNAVSCVLSTAWTRYSATFTVPVSCLNIIPMVWTNGLPAANDDLLIAEASLTDGANIVDWAPLSLPQELVRAERFYGKTFAVDTAPAQNAGLNTGEYRFPATMTAATAGIAPSYAFKATMRTVPTVTTYNPAAANAQVRDVTAGADCSGVGSLEGQNHTTVSLTGDAGTAVGNVLAVHLTFSAEL